MKDRIEARLVVDENGCWIWTGRLNTSGYGQVSINGRLTLVHHIMLERAGRPRPPGMEADHLCRVPRCANPDHIEWVTHAENMRRSVGSSSRKTACPRGHPYDGINSKGGRFCLRCRRDADRAWYWRNRDKKRTANAAAYQRRKDKS